MNIPNKLTILRIILVPIFLVCLINFKLFYVAGGIFVIASITDFLDGKIARKYDLVTNFGKFADPLADKLLVSAALIGLCACGRLGTDIRLGVWAAFIIIAREFIITGMRLIAASDGVVISAAMSGKIKTVIQMITITYLLFEDFFKLVLKFMNITPSICDIVANIFVIASVIMTVYSGVEYIIKNRNLFKMEK